MNNPTKEQILASSSGWVAATLNFLPGLGAGYLYQRRWVPYFITVGVATAWFILGAVLNGDAEPTKAEQLIGVGGLFLISITTMIEAKITHKKVSNIAAEQLQATPPKKRRGLFR
tara:strand:+ start:6525 stop:6869 length:345 start_codon:yes stop_codon:yes gene_type:complete